MRFNPFILCSAAAISLGVVSTAAYFYKSRNKEVNDVMVFCKLQFNAWSCFDKFISYIENAKTSINICMPSIHNPAIQGRLVKILKEKNVKVRIVIEPNGYNTSTDFFFKELIDAGAEIKCKVNEPFNMQHKFCLVDDKILMTGTLNWGDDRSSDNWNYVYVTNKPQLVEPVKSEFYQMWSKDIDLEVALKKEPVVYDSDEGSSEHSFKDLNNDSQCEANVEPHLVEVTPLTPELCIA